MITTPTSLCPECRSPMEEAFTPAGEAVLECINVRCRKTVMATTLAWVMEREIAFVSGRRSEFQYDGYLGANREHVASGKTALAVEEALDEVWYAQLLTHNPDGEGNPPDLGDDGPGDTVPEDFGTCDGFPWQCDLPATEAVVAYTGADWETRRAVRHHFCSRCAADWRDAG